MEGPESRLIQKLHHRSHNQLSFKRSIKLQMAVVIVVSAAGAVVAFQGMLLPRPASASVSSQHLASGLSRDFQFEPIPGIPIRHYPWWVQVLPGLGGSQPGGCQVLTLVSRYVLVAGGVYLLISPGGSHQPQVLSLSLFRASHSLRTIGHLKRTRLMSPAFTHTVTGSTTCRIFLSPPLPFYS